jgi:hypothetical protein
MPQFSRPLGRSFEERMTTIGVTSGAGAHASGVLQMRHAIVTPADDSNLLASD